MSGSNVYAHLLDGIVFDPEDMSRDSTKSNSKTQWTK
jgi:hypothetical protein